MYENLTMYVLVHNYYTMCAKKKKTDFLVPATCEFGQEKWFDALDCCPDYMALGLATPFSVCTQRVNVYVLSLIHI